MANKTHTLETIEPTPERISDLCKEQGGLRISLYLPVRSSPPESDQNPIILRQTVDKLRETLQANGMEDEHIEELIAPLTHLVDNPRELLPWSPGVAVFIDQNRHQAVKLADPVDPMYDVSNRFFIKPLIAAVFQNPTYTILTLNRDQIAAWRANRTRLDPLDIPDMPEKLSDITGIDDPEKSLQQHTAKRASAEGRPGSSPVMETHGHGLPADLEESQFNRFFREVAKQVHAFLSGRKDPLVLFGVEENIGLLRNHYKWKDRPIRQKIGDAGEWKEERLLEESWKLVEPLVDDQTDEILNNLNALANKGEGLFKVEETAMGAATGRIETVVIASDKTVYGICNPDTMEVRLVDTDEPGCAHDLLDYIASETIRHGGEVIALPAERIPGGGIVAASTRF